LDLWLAAGLLRLVLPPTWEQLLTAAAVIAVRQMVGPALRPGRPPRPVAAVSDTARPEPAP
jgi:hypothetical protein